MSQLERVALVVHPTRDIARAVDALERWTAVQGVEMVQLETYGGTRRVAPAGTVGPGDLVVALGGDGTMLAALRAAAPTDTPVLGVACGSLGAMSAVSGDSLDAALDRFRTGDWTVRSLAALSIESDAGGDWAVNDFVVVRHGTGQIAAEITVDDELYVRLAGDGVIVATALGSSAYSMAAGGPILAHGAAAFVCTPMAMHGGCAPPVVIPAGATLTMDVEPGHAGFDVEIDGRVRELPDRRFRVALHPEKLSLVTFAPADGGLAGLRRRGIITDSPRILARDARAARRRD
jgi:NAD+ kinase